MCPSTFESNLDLNRLNVICYLVLGEIEQASEIYCTLKWLNGFQLLDLKILHSKSIPSKWNAIICKWGDRLKFHLNVIYWRTCWMKPKWVVLVFECSLPLTMKIYWPMPFSWQKNFFPSVISIHVMWLYMNLVLDTCCCQWTITPGGGWKPSGNRQVILTAAG